MHRHFLDVGCSCYLWTATRNQARDRSSSGSSLAQMSTSQTKESKFSNTSCTECFALCMRCDKSFSPDVHLGAQVTDWERLGGLPLIRLIPGWWFNPGAVSEKGLSSPVWATLRPWEGTLSCWSSQVSQKEDFKEPAALLEKSRGNLPGAGVLSYIGCTNNSDSSRWRATL